MFNWRVLKRTLVTMVQWCWWSSHVLQRDQNNTPSDRPNSDHFVCVCVCVCVCERERERERDCSHVEDLFVYVWRELNKMGMTPPIELIYSELQTLLLHVRVDAVAIYPQLFIHSTIHSLFGLPHHRQHITCNSKDNSSSYLITCMIYVRPFVPYRCILTVSTIWHMLLNLHPHFVRNKYLLFFFLFLPFPLAALAMILLFNPWVYWTCRVLHCKRHHRCSWEFCIRLSFMHIFQLWFE